MTPTFPKKPATRPIDFGKSIDQTSGETHLRHNVSPEGYYKGRKVIDTKVVEIEDDEE